MCELVITSEQDKPSTPCSKEKIRLGLLKLFYTHSYMEDRLLLNG